MLLTTLLEKGGYSRNFNELIKEESQKEANKHPRMFIGESEPEDDWGKVKIPEWLMAKAKSGLVAIAMNINETDYEQMISSIKDLYPDVYFNSTIDTNDFIGALGIAYAHRIMAGQVQLEVTVRQVKK